MTTAVNLLTK